VSLEKSVPHLSIIIPTFNEALNIAALVDLLTETLRGHHWEVIFVDDDSPDGTAEIAKRLAHENEHVRCLHRIGRRGLAGACIEGALSSSADYIVIMDADFQHDEKIIPTMIERLRAGADVVIGTREREQSNMVFTPWRARASSVATFIARFLIGTQFADPMSGFFALKRHIITDNAALLSPTGFKILLDIMTLPKARFNIEEVFYSFRMRDQGESKFDLKNIFDYLGLLGHKLSGGFLPHRFILFSFIGSMGVIVHFLCLLILSYLKMNSFIQSQSMATIVVMTTNYFMNNMLTYSDMSLRGKALVFGLLKFYLVCSIGAIANIGVANLMFDYVHNWFLAGLCGILIGSIFNFVLSESVIWGRHLARQLIVNRSTG
jgi:dolichol-phosphate mannosyltransferase